MIQIQNKADAVCYMLEPNDLVNVVRDAPWQEFVVAKKLDRVKGMGAIEFGSAVTLWCKKLGRGPLQLEQLIEKALA